MRNFANIMEDKKKQRNMLELKVAKICPERGPNPAMKPGIPVREIIAQSPVTLKDHNVTY